MLQDISSNCVRCRNSSYSNASSCRTFPHTPVASPLKTLVYTCHVQVLRVSVVLSNWPHWRNSSSLGASSLKTLPHSPQIAPKCVPVDPDLTSGDFTTQGEVTHKLSLRISKKVPSLSKERPASRKRQTSHPATSTCCFSEKVIVSIVGASSIVIPSMCILF